MCDERSNLIKSPTSWKHNCANFARVHSAVKYRVMAGASLNFIKVLSHQATKIFKKMDRLRLLKILSILVWRPATRFRFFEAIALRQPPSLHNASNLQTIFIETTRITLQKDIDWKLPGRCSWTKSEDVDFDTRAARQTANNTIAVDSNSHTALV